MRSNRVFSFLFYWLPPIIMMVAIFYFSSRERIAVADTYLLNFLVFKTLHVLEYAVLYLLIFRAFRTQFHYALLFSLLYALSDEIHQTFVPTREGRLRDVGIDAIGISLMYIFIKHNFFSIKKFLL